MQRNKSSPSAGGNEIQIVCLNEFEILHAFLGTYLKERNNHRCRDILMYVVHNIVEMHKI